MQSLSRLFAVRPFAAASLIVALLMPALASARELTDYVRTEASVVSRGEFLTWTVNAFESKRFESCTLDYVRVPRGMIGTLCVAQSKGALDPFGDDLQLGQPITRGEALLILTDFSGKSSRTSTSAFRDVRTSEMQAAVANAVENRWMNPLQPDFFGVSRRLSGTEALTVLQSVIGDTPRQTTQQVRINVGSSPSTTSTSGLTSTLPKTDLINSIWQLIRRDYLRTDDIDEKEVGYKIIEGMLEGLDDPYTSFFRPVAADNFQTQINGELSGIGAHVELRNDVLTIIAPLTGSPAEKAGLKPGDEILSANGVSLEGMAIDEAVSHIRGETGTSVSLRIRRNGSELTVTVIRQTINIPEVEITQQGNIFIVKIVQFGQTTNSQIRDLMNTIAESNPTGIVLDLRNNPGGLLSAADELVSNFVPKGSVVAQVRGRTTNGTELTSGAPTINDSVKVAVLVNGGSASASEIVAGALQDYGRAKVIGVQTFGKGTVQELLSFQSGEAVKITVAEWLTPNGRTINKTGVTPDVIVENEDQQLQQAINLVK